jgi:hypothetical protein
MRIVHWRLAAWAVLASGVVVGPLAAAPPKTAGHTTTPGQATPTGTTGHTTNLGRPGTTGTTGQSGFGGANTGSGNANAGTLGAGQSNPKAKADTALGLLHDAQHLVSGAHFSYDGHKAQALKEIHRAIQELTPPKPPSTNPAGQTQPQTQPHPQGQTHSQTHPAGQAGAPAKPPQTQAEADAKLKDAIELLTRAQTRITNQDALDDINAAVKGLKAALQLPGTGGGTGTTGAFKN